ncbi:hypothetical protein Tco_0562498 [Tanacetum coccineum]
MLVDTLLHHEVEGQVDRLVEEVEELKSKQAEVLDELAIKVDEVTERMELLAKSLTLLLEHRKSKDNAADENIHEDDRNANIGNGRNRCSYKDFVTCKPKESDGKGDAVAYIRWVEKMEVVQDIRDYGDS